MAIKKSVRELVWVKYDKHCSYCGEEIEYNQMQVDHLIPQRNFLVHIKNEWKVPNWLKHLTESDVDHFDNLMPSCRVCNKWKDTHDIEQFRIEIQEQLNRLKSNSSNYRMALKYGMIKENNEPIVFYFEKHNAK
jgi:5-methylcytosine-specific restriction endonuclease McrA